MGLSARGEGDRGGGRGGSRIKLEGTLLPISSLRQPPAIFTFPEEKLENTARVRAFCSSEDAGEA